MRRDRDPYRDQQHVPDTFWLAAGAVRRLRAGCG